MNIAKNEIFNKICAIVILAILVISDLVPLGTVAVSYAIDVIQTNHVNVDFSAYFLDENGEKVESMHKSISEQEYMYIDISVKNEGYFNGKIAVNNGNLNIKEEKLSPEIAEISGNTVTLNQINAGNTVTIKLQVEAIKENTVIEKQLNSKTNVVLEGQYVNSKNIQKDKYVDIKGTTNVEMAWETDEQASAKLSAGILTNSVYEVNGETKRIVQILVNSKLSENSYPVKNTEIVANVPETVEEVKVHARSLEATNSNIAFGEKNYVYNKEENKLTINVSNDDKNAISWNKGVKDTYVITYVFDAEENILNKDISVESKLTTYDKKELKANQDVHIEKEIDGIVSATSKSRESSIYKGKVYTGEGRDYTVNSKINIDFVNVAKNVEITEQAKYLAGDAEGKANITYKQTKIDKEEFLKLFGEDGNIKIKNEEGTIVANINKNTEADENGKIVIEYAKEISKITIVATEPIDLGTLNVEQTKTILETGYTREQIARITGIKEEIETSYNSKVVANNNSQIELKETSSEAAIDISTTTLASAEKNENVKIKAVLLNNNESMDLYQNPTVKIEFPEQVNDVSAKCKLLYGNGLEIADAKKNVENGLNCLEINLAGTQLAYNEETLEGTTLVVYADLDVNRLEEDLDSEIKLTYTNELATNYKDMGEEKSAVKIFKSTALAPEMIMATAEAGTNEGVNLSSNLKAYVGEKEIQNGDTVYTGEVIRYELTLENKGNEDIRNIIYEAIIPDNTTAIRYVKCTDVIETDGPGEYSAKDYYEIVETVDSKILGTIETLRVNEKKTVTYEIKVNDEAESTNILSYVQIQFNETETSTVKTNEISNIVSKSEIEMEIIMARRVEHLYVGDSYYYYLTVKNVSENNLSNVKIETKLDSYIMEHIYNEFDGQEVDFENNTFIINSLNQGEEIKYVIEVKTNDNKPTAGINVVANDLYYSNRVDEKVENIDIAVSMESANNGQEIQNGEKVVYNIEVQNIGNADIDNLRIAQQMSIYLNIDKIVINGQEMDISKLSKTNSFEIEDIENENNDKTRISNAYIASFNYEDILKVGESVSISVETLSDSEYMHSSDIIMKSFATVYAIGTVNETEEVRHILASNINLYKEEEEYDDEPGQDEPGQDEPGQDEPGQDEPGTDEPVEQEKKYTISGTAWLDENGNGQRDSKEETLAGIKVKILNLENKKSKETITTEKGTYKFTDIPKGKYVAIFEYDKEKYMLTTYQAEGVAESKNSDVENVTMNIEGENKKVASTDTINVDGRNITNIDIGLMNLKTFDLELSKTISRVVIKNEEGTKTTEYKDSNLVKAEIKAKYLRGTTVLVEYKIKVTNKGELAGYAKNIVDYKPNDLSFNSSINPTWYQSGNELYSTSLKDTKIEPGETKELTLILTKTMTESNTGLVNNMAEIKEDYNSLSIADIDSVVGNKDKSEDDMGSANLIISVSTGATVSYLIITLLTTTIIGILAYFTIEKILKNDIKI